LPCAAAWLAQWIIEDVVPLEISQIFRGAVGSMDPVANIVGIFSFTACTVSEQERRGEERRGEERRGEERRGE
jgi:hypothetical protein